MTAAAHPSRFARRHGGLLLIRRPRLKSGKRRETEDGGNRGMPQGVSRVAKAATAATRESQNLGMDSALDNSRKGPHLFRS
jgi:hypothetical protein